jgi:hypothetical protein
LPRQLLEAIVERRDEKIDLRPVPGEIGAHLERVVMRAEQNKTGTDLFICWFLLSVYK